MCTQERYLTNLHGGNILSLNMFFSYRKRADKSEEDEDGPAEDDESKGPSKRLQHLLQHLFDFVERCWKVVE